MNTAVIFVEVLNIRGSVAPRAVIQKSCLKWLTNRLLIKQMLSLWHLSTCLSVCREAMSVCTYSFMLIHGNSVLLALHHFISAATYFSILIHINLLYKLYLNLSTFPHLFICLLVFVFFLIKIINSYLFHTEIIDCFM